MSSVCLATPQSRVMNFDVSEDRFAAHLRSKFSLFFPELNPQKTTVRTTHQSIRKKSSLFEFEIGDGTLRKKVICKIPFSLQDASAVPPVEDRPLLFPSIDPVSNGLREYLALESIEHHFSELHDPRFGTIAALELLESPFVVLMEKSADGSLKSLLKKSTRFHRMQRSASELSPAFRNAGSWLREFHTIPRLPHTQERHSDRACYLDAVRKFTNALSLRLNHKLFFQNVRQQLHSAALQILPQEIPCATVHGDFAPRNILIGLDSRVTVIDTLRRWSAPVYEDLAYMIMSFKLPRLQVSSQGLFFTQTQLAMWETDVLTGYFSSSLPRAAVRLYEVLLTLDWWTAASFRTRNCSGLQRLGNSLCNRYLFHHVSALLNDLQQLTGQRTRKVKLPSSRDIEAGPA